MDGVSRMNRLSHSAANKYQECPTAYRYHYIEKLRPKITNSYFMFGRAVDAASTEVLKGSGLEQPVYDKTMAFVDINGIMSSAPKNADIVYGVNEFDSELLLPEDVALVKAFSKEMFGDEEWETNYGYVQEERKKLAFDKIEMHHRRFYNYCNWLCLYRRGLLMVDAFKTDFMPKVVKVHSVQEKIELTNEEGDSIIGYIDFVAELKDEGTVVFDLKTSASQYAEGAVLTSPQLSIYLSTVKEKYNTNKAGFCVLNKQVIKNRVKVCSVCGNDGTGGRHKTCDAVKDGQRCNGKWDETIKPKVAVQVLINEVPERTQEIVLENYEHINQLIKNQVFQRNFQSCIKYGSVKCSYYNKCFSNNDEGLEKVGS